MTKKELAFFENEIESSFLEYKLLREKRNLTEEERRDMDQFFNRAIYLENLLNDMRKKNILKNG